MSKSDLENSNMSAYLPPWRDFGLMILVCVVVTLAYLGYLVIIGIPSTSARNLYNEAQLTNNPARKQHLLEESLDIWYEEYVWQELQQLKQTSN